VRSWRGGMERHDDEVMGVWRGRFGRVVLTG